MISTKAKERKDDKKDSRSAMQRQAKTQTDFLAVGSDKRLDATKKEEEKKSPKRTTERSGRPPHSERHRSRTPLRLRSSPSRFVSVFARGSVLRKLLDEKYVRSDWTVATLLFVFNSSYDDALLNEHYAHSMEKVEKAVGRHELPMRHIA